MNLTARVDVNAPPETVFTAATDWQRQSEWMLGTAVRVRRGDGRSVGSEVEAVTGLRGIGITDRMRITVWDAPFRCEMRHLGRVVRGTGSSRCSHAVATPPPSSGPSSWSCHWGCWAPWAGHWFARSSAGVCGARWTNSRASAGDTPDESPGMSHR